MIAMRHCDDFRATALVVVVSLAIGAQACRDGDAKPLPDQPPPDEIWLTDAQVKKVDVKIAIAEERDIPQAITAGGRVAFNDLHVTHIFSPVTGRVTRVLAQPGQRVKRGTPLLALASPDVGQAFSDVVKAHADLAASEADYQRQTRLFGAKAASQRDYEQAEDTFRTATAEYQRAQKRAALLRSGSVDAVTQEYILKSYIEGEVIARMINPGVEVQGQYSGGTSAELFTIGDIKAVWVLADVADLDLAAIKLGADVEIRAIAYPDRIFHGQVDWISSTVDPALRTGRVRCALPNDNEELKPEMVATVSIARPSRRLLAVPHDAIVRLNESTFAYVAYGLRPDGRLTFKRRLVRVGDEQNGWWPVVSGLEAGERVVNGGSVSHEQPSDEVWLTPQQMQAAGITVSEVREQDIHSLVSLGGRLTFDDLRVTHVFSPVNGRVTKVLAQPGQRVIKGTPLLALSSPDVGQFAADVVKAEAAVVAAEHEYQRQKELYSFAGPVRAGTLKDLEAAESNWRKAKAEVDRARQKARLLKTGSVDTVTQDFILRSPIEGDIIARATSPGLEVQGQYAIGGNVVELFTVGSTERLWLIGDVQEIDRPHVNKGDEVTLKVSAYPDRTFRGTVDWVADVMDPILHVARIRCVIDNSEHLLRPEMYEALEVAIPGKHTPAIPRRALMRLGADTVVFVATDKKRPDGALVFKKRPVVVNEVIEGDTLPVFGGLKPGETIVVDHAVLLLGLL